MKAPVQPTNNGMSISLYVQPGASKTEWSGMQKDVAVLGETDALMEMANRLL